MYFFKLPSHLFFCKTLEFASSKHLRKRDMFDVADSTWRVPPKPSEAVVHLLEALHGLRQEDEVLGLETENLTKIGGKSDLFSGNPLKNNKKTCGFLLKFAPRRVTFLNFATELQAMWEHARCQRRNAIKQVSCWRSTFRKFLCFFL